MRAIGVFSRYSKPLEKLMRIKLTTFWVHIGIKNSLYWHYLYFSLRMSYHPVKCQKTVGSKFQVNRFEINYFLFCFLTVSCYCKKFKKNCSSWFQEQNVQVFRMPHSRLMGVFSRYQPLPVFLTSSVLLPWILEKSLEKIPRAKCTYFFKWPILGQQEIFSKYRFLSQFSKYNDLTLL